ncbi:MAG: PocR ligand-binding domain-containing protein, partial [Phycisphaerales bacterium]
MFEEENVGMIPDEISAQCRLTDQELRELFPREHLEALVFGYMIRPKVLGGIMLRAKDSSEKCEHVFYRCTEYHRFQHLVQCRWCLFMRNDPVLRKACEDCDQFAFEVAEECAKDSSWGGFTYLCKGGLIDFVVPIRIDRTRDFIGIAFHGQFRPYDKDTADLTCRLRCFRRNVASALGILDELVRYDSIPVPSSTDIRRINAAIGKALCDSTRQVGEGQGYILAVPLTQMRDLYETAPMLKCSGQILINLPGTRHAWQSDPNRRAEIISGASLTSVSFRPVGTDGKDVEE